MQGCVHIVDDDASFRTAMERRLKKPATRSRPMLRPSTCWIACQAKASRAAFSLTCGYRDLDGPALQTRLSELGSTLPIVFLTGYPDIPTTVRTIKAGAEDFLTKPVSSDELLRAIERAIAHHQATRGLKSKLESFVLISRH